MFQRERGWPEKALGARSGRYAGALGEGGLESVLGNYDEEWHTEMMPENINSRGQIRFWSKYGTPNGSETSSHSMS
jgi:hypothetical protein